MSTEVISTGTPVEPAKMPKNFRSSSDVENFYRFVFENSLRGEAKIILASAVKMMKEKKKKRKKKKTKKIQ